MGTALPLSAMLLQTILLSDEGYIIDFGTVPLQILFHGLMVLLLIFAIAKLLIKPVQNMLQKRQDTIQQSLDNAADSEKKAAELKADYEQKLADAAKEREAILEKAYASAKEREAQVLADAREEADRLRDRARRDIEQEREKARSEIQQESIGIAAAMTEKLLDRYVDDDVRNRLVEDAIHGLEEAEWSK